MPTFGLNDRIVVSTHDNHSAIPDLPRVHVETGNVPVRVDVSRRVVVDVGDAVRRAARSSVDSSLTGPITAYRRVSLDS